MEPIFQNIVDESNHPVFIFHKTTLNTVFANKKAIALYGNHQGQVLLKDIFIKQEPDSVVYHSVLEELEKTGVANLYHWITVTNRGEEKNTTIQIGYGSSEKDQIFMHFSMPTEEVSQQELAKGEENQNIADYFNVLQSLSKDFLYRFNIKTKTLYRNEATAQLYGIEAVVENYPNAAVLKGVFHPDDMDAYLSFMDSVIQGVEGSITARMIAPSGSFEYHTITFMQLKSADGEIREMIANAVNVHDLVETEEKLANINEYFNILQTLSKDLLYRLDIEKRILYRNSETSKFYGIPSEVPNYPNLEEVRRIFHPDDMAAYMVFIEDVMKGNEGVHTARMTAPSGLFEYHRITFKQLRRPDGTIKEMIGTAENIQQIMELETKASHDLLTKCLNKIYFQEMVSKTLSQENPGQHALLFLDMDEFKFVNDQLGHAFGDHVIKELGKRLRDNIGPEDFVGRVGGDEFVLFYKNITTDDVVLGRAKMLLRAIGEDICDSTHCHTMRGSIGISRFPEHGTSYEELYHHADMALYESKNRGKNTATIYEPQG